MTSPQKKEVIGNSPQASDQPSLSLTSSSSQDSIKTTHTDELVFALCGPIGSPLHKVAEELQRIMEDEYLYEVSILRLSSVIEGIAEKSARTISKDTEFTRIQELIKEGNNLRKKYGNSILAELCIHKITKQRELARKKSTDESPEVKRYTSKRTCHIIDSIKNKDELNILKSVYGDMLYFIGVYSPLSSRIETLKARSMSDPEVSQLIDKDSGEEIEHGQSVRETFPMSDYFLHIDNNSSSLIKGKLKRFTSIIFQTEITTPTHHEKAMYLAATASLNSACLSRQVGACVTDSDGNVLSIGWNDVPRYGGDLYHFTPDNEFNNQSDLRCHNFEEICFNDKEKREIVLSISKELASALAEKSFVDKEKKVEVEAAINDLISKSRIDNLRPLHKSREAENFSPRVTFSPI